MGSDLKKWCKSIKKSMKCSQMKNKCKLFLFAIKNWYNNETRHIKSWRKYFLYWSIDNNCMRQIVAKKNGRPPVLVFAAADLNSAGKLPRNILWQEKHVTSWRLSDGKLFFPMCHSHQLLLFFWESGRSFFQLQFAQSTTISCLFSICLL